MTNKLDKISKKELKTDTKIKRQMIKNDEMHCIDCKRVIKKNIYFKCENCGWQDVLFRRYLDTK